MPYFKKYFLSALVISVCFVFLVQPLFVSAQQVNPINTLKNTAEKGGLIEKGSDPSLAIFIGNMIRVVLGFLGVIFFILIIFGGFTWMTAAGNEEQVGKGKKIVINATIGLVIIVLAYVITAYVLDRIVNLSKISTPAT